MKLAKVISPKVAATVIKIAMIKVYTDYLDDSNCLNTTRLAENIADQYGDNPADGSPIDEIYYDCAVEVSRDLFKQGLINE